MVWSQKSFEHNLFTIFGYYLTYFIVFIYYYLVRVSACVREGMCTGSSKCHCQIVGGIVRMCPRPQGQCVNMQPVFSLRSLIVLPAERTV